MPTACYVLFGITPCFPLLFIAHMPVLKAWVDESLCTTSVASGSNQVFLVVLITDETLIKLHLCYCWAELVVLAVSSCLVQSHGLQNHFPEIRQLILWVLNFTLSWWEISCGTLASHYKSTSKWKHTIFTENIGYTAAPFKDAFLLFALSNCINHENYKKKKNYNNNYICMEQNPF